MKDFIVSLIWNPTTSKRYDVPWKTLESRGYIAEAICTEYRIPLSSEEELKYAHADKRAKFRIAAENQRKKELVRELLDNHAGESILIIGQFISQLEKLAKVLGCQLSQAKYGKRTTENF